jgi:murein L,D-transpeptidase YcbB/YkuD
VLLKQQLKTDDSSFHWAHFASMKYVYEKNNFHLIWSDSGKWKSSADSFFIELEGAPLKGLFPGDYHYEKLNQVRELIKADSPGTQQRLDPMNWAKADLLLTDAWFNFIHDIKLGRLPADSVSLNRDSVISDESYYQAFLKIGRADSIRPYIASLEPEEKGYGELKNAIPDFLRSAKFKTYTAVPSPLKDNVGFRKALQRRLFEEGFVSQDSLQLAVKKFQQAKGITNDGKAGAGTIRMLNLSDEEKFIRIAITLDKYKKLPPVMPEKYIWVNVSANMLRVMENGHLKFSSKVITGKPLTRTPMLTSMISALITYPQWVPPPSIITKEILPAVKKNPAYLAKKGFSLLDNKGNEVDPFTVDWKKYDKTMPYKVVQGSGDANALGIIKFHFDNKYAVYLHDTNQRYLFANAMRSLSHGCVRVQMWRELVNYLLLNDSLHWVGKYNRKDSVNNWLKNKEKRQLALKTRLPVFIRYLTCEGLGGKVVFYDDVYGDDKMLREKYFTRK